MSGLTQVSEFYITNVLSRMRTDTPWTLNETKLLLVVLARISEHRIFLRKSDDISSLTDDKLQEMYKDIPMSFTISKDEFIAVTGCRSEHLAREVKQTCKLLMKKDSELPSPFAPDDPKSFRLLSWFTRAEYVHKMGVIYIDLTKMIIPYLAVLTQYTKVDFKHFSRIKNRHAIHIYILIKISIKSFENQGSLEYTIDEFKSFLHLNNKYASIPKFKTGVLDVIAEEINNETDITFSYELIKIGRSYKRIVLNFSECKSEITKIMEVTPESVQPPLSQQQISSYEQIKAKLKLYGFTASKSEEILEKHGASTVEQAIESVRDQIKKGKKIPKISGYLLKCIENHSMVSSDTINDRLIEEEKQNAKKSDELNLRWNSAEKYIKENEYKLNKIYIMSLTEHKLYMRIDIEFLEEIKMFIEHYSDISTFKRPFDGCFVNDGKLGFGFSLLYKVSSHFSEASNVEKVNHIKNIILEKKELIMTNEFKGEKKVIQREINILQDEVMELI